MNDHLWRFHTVEKFFLFFFFLSWPLIAINHRLINEEKIEICRVIERNEREIANSKKKNPSRGLFFSLDFSIFFFSLLERMSHKTDLKRKIRSNSETTNNSDLDLMEKRIRIRRERFFNLLPRFLCE